ncbi:MAG TPA: hypothetical protein V6C81_11430 [Planktothrix sp.]|jgi:uncharacterized membrane protein YqgA involved in biofilm formation
MIWLIVSLILAAAGFFSMKRLQQRFPKTLRIYGASMSVFAVLMAISVPWLQSNLIFLAVPLIFGGAVGAAITSDAQKAAAAEKEEEERQRKIKARVLSFCPVCASSLVAKPEGEQGQLLCPSCFYEVKQPA